MVATVSKAAIAKLGLQASDPLNILIQSVTDTSGVRNENIIRATITPTGPSTLQYFLKQAIIDYVSSQNMGSGGYLNPLMSVLNTAPGSGTHDKLVGALSQMNLLGGNVTSALGFEFTLPTIGASTLIGSLAAYYVPNLSGVANIGNVGQGYAFANDMVAWPVLNLGKYLNADLRELGATTGPELIANRYYSAAPHSATGAVAPNKAYLQPFYFPSRKTSFKVSVNVTSALATSKAILAAFKTSGGKIQALIGQLEVDTATTGVKEVTINAQVEAGPVMLCALFSHAISIGVHAIPSDRTAIFGSETHTDSAPMTAYIDYAYGALPSNGNSVPLQFSTNSGFEPHICVRV